MTKILNLSLISILIFQVLVASGFELAHDEAYYWLYSRHLDWGFFDHPPAVGVIIRFFSFLPHSEIAVRLGFILLQITASLLLIREVPKNRHFLALILFFACPLASFGGLLALPDLPLLFMTTVYCVMLKRFLEKEDNFSIYGLTLAIPLLLYSKYHGILVVFFTILAVPQLLKRKNFWLIAGGSLAIFWPHVLWQYQHDFSTLKYHFLERPKSDFSLARLLEYSVTQIFLAGLFVGPVVWWTTLKIKTKTEFERALKFICIGTFVFFFISTFSKKFEANWTIFLTAPLILLTMPSLVWDKKWVKVILGISFSIVMLARVLLVLDPTSVNISRLHEFHGWKKWAQEVDEKCEEPIMANTYQTASKLSFYLNQPVHALNYNSRKNQFDYWMHDEDYYLTPKVCYITDKKKQFPGVEIYSPDGKKLHLVKGFKPGSLSVKVRDVQ
jgi:hypothetical protein